MTTSYQPVGTDGIAVHRTSAVWNDSRVAADTGRAIMQALALPFDAARTQYARAAQCGFIRRSMLVQREFERALGSAERLLLGPWARRR